MKVAALVLGILGGLFGLGGSVAVMFVGGFGSALGAEGADTVIGLGFLFAIGSLLGLIAGALAMAKPKFAGWTMLVCAVLGFITVHWFSGALLLAGGILAVAGAAQDKKDAAKVA